MAADTASGDVAPERKDRENFTVVIPKKLEEAFKKLGVEDITDYYEGKTVRVTGVLTEFRGRPQMIVSGWPFRARIRSFSQVP